MSCLCPFKCEELEQALLKGKRCDREWAEIHVWAVRSGLCRAFVEFRRVESDEVLTTPVRLKDGGNLVDHVWIPSARGPNVPLQTGLLGRVREI